MNLEERVAKKLKDREELFFIDAFLEEHPHAELYLVGGAVRDALLGRKMKEIDYDFVIRNLEPDTLKAWFEMFGEVNLVGQHFGVYKFLPTGFSRNQIQDIDIALPRTEQVASGSLGGYKDFEIQSDALLPIEDDLARRDFTVNAMAFNIRTGELIDPYNGQIDLEEKCIRAVGDPNIRFQEDLSRMLRGIRFAAELHFEIDPETTEAIRASMPQINTQKEHKGKTEFVVPREVIGLELAKALNRNPVRAIHECVRHGALHELLPRVAKLMEVDAHYLDPLREVHANEITVATTLLLRGLSEIEIGKAMTQTGLRTLPKGSKLRLDANEIHLLIRRLQESFTPQDVATMSASLFERTFMNGRGKLLNRCLELIEKGDVAQAARDRREDIEERWLVDGDEKIAPLLSGNDILEHGVKAGPKVRMWLDRVRDEQLEGRLMDRKQALTWLKENLKKEHL